MFELRVGIFSADQESNKSGAEMKPAELFFSLLCFQLESCFFFPVLNTLQFFVD